MITVAEAKNIIAAHVQPLPTVTIDLQDAAGMRLAADLFSPINLPPFNQSAVDGYAFAYSSWQPGKPLTLKGEIPAGAMPATAIALSMAVRIFTGAMLPIGADTVVMQEKTTVQNGALYIEDEALTAGANVRLQGADIQKGVLALAADTVLQPAAIGFVAGLGIDKVAVQQKPVVHIIVTGNELQQPGTPLTGAKVYESNSYMLRAALQQIGVAVQVICCEDDFNTLSACIVTALQQADIVLLTGGVSVGDYDFVPAAAAAWGGKPFFYKKRQKPGKTPYFCKKDTKLVFGLPGNPSSVLTCFYEYVWYALHLLNYSIRPIQIKQVPLLTPVQKNTTLTHFLKANYDGKTVQPLGAQESYRLSSFATANCLIVIPENVQYMSPGDIAEIHLLPANDF
ncbi:MAG TPA: molybdopterin molybdotransferase MoeA [Ferruginibacter sp.]|nr:molybdopterin molybdotransferase MoeA [Ferruginibacter sp.]